MISADLIVGYVNKYNLTDGSDSISFPDLLGIGAEANL